MSSTSQPWSRKYSAMPVATDGHFFRSMAGWSEVATTRTERFMPSGPRSFSMNSSTSRPRSPTRAMTLMSALTFLAIMPMRVLLPTPEPAKMPTRWPLPMVSILSMALMPNSIRSRMGGRWKGLISSDFSTQKGVPPGKGPLPSMGRPRASITRPLRKGPTVTFRRLPVLRTKLPAEMPSMLA